jgi:hypothetical protein
MAEIKILDARPVPSVREGRAGKIDRLVIYQADGGSPRLFHMPDEDFDEAKLQNAVRADLDEQARLRGKTFRV